MLIETCSFAQQRLNFTKRKLAFYRSNEAAQLSELKQKHQKKSKGLHGTLNFFGHFALCFIECVP